jgi:O-succinylbenzoate synthase
LGAVCGGTTVTATGYGQMSPAGQAGACDDGPVLDPLPPVDVEAIELVTVPMALATPFATVHGSRAEREVLLVHIRAAQAEGWAEVAVEPTPSYAPEHTAGERAVLADHLVPLAWAGPTGDGVALGAHLGAVRGHHPARAALELAVLDAQLRAADRSLAAWLGATATEVGAGASIGLHDDEDGLLAEADAVLAAGAARIRLKVAPGRAAGPLCALRAHVGPDIRLQADANGSFRLEDPAHLAELEACEDAGLACFEQPLDPTDLLGHARLAERLATPICLDEPLTSIGALEAAVALGACAVACLKPGRVGGWPEALRFARVAAQLSVPVWIGGMLETAVGRAANAALAAAVAGPFAPDLDPRGRFDPDLADPLLPVDGTVAVPSGPGTGAAPPVALLVGAGVDVTISRRPR